MSSTKKRVTFNALSAIIQVAFTAFIYFFLYRYLIKNLGVEQLGVWSLILSFSSIANLANFGITSGLVKFVAEYVADQLEKEIGKLILTSAFSVIAIFIPVCLIVNWGADYFLQFVIDNNYLNTALMILPYSLAGLCINAVSGVFTSVLEGFQKNYIRNYIYVFSGIVMVGFTLYLTPIYGLRGVAIAQLIQAFFVLFSSILAMIKVSDYSTPKYWRWCSNTFKSLFNYGYKFQTVSICQLLYEPTTKLLLSKFGGLALLGHYEMAARLANQVRAIIVNANQVVVPIVAEKIKTQTRENLHLFYINMNRTILLFTLPVFSLFVFITPLISLLWIGHIENEFINSAYILSICLAINCLSNPAFFSCMGEGCLNIPIISHISMAIINFVFGILFAQFFGGYGIIIGWALAVILGSFTTIYLYNKKKNITFRKLYSTLEIKIAMLCIVAVALSISLHLFMSTPIYVFGTTVLISSFYILIIVYVINKTFNIKNLISVFSKN